MEQRKPRTQIERRQQAEERILEAAEELLTQKGYSGFSLAEVGEKAGYSRGLPAHYFGKKEDLLKRVVERSIERFHSDFSQLPPTERGFPKIAALIRHHYRGARLGGARVVLIVLARALIDPQMRPTLEQLNDQAQSVLAEEIELGKRAANIRADVDAQLQAKLIHTHLRGQLTVIALNPDEDVETPCELFISALESSISAAV